MANDNVAGAPTEGVAKLAGEASLLLEQLRDLSFLEDRKLATAETKSILERAEVASASVVERQRLNAYFLLRWMETGGKLIDAPKAATVPQQAILHLHEIMGCSGQPLLGARLVKFYRKKWKGHGLGRWGQIVSSIRVDGPRFRDDPAADVQVVRCEGATSTLIVFTGLRHALGIPLALAYRCWLSHLNANVIFLRDFSNCLFVNGIRSVGDHNASVTRLRSILGELGSQRVSTIGFSAGSFGAYFYGALLDVDQVVALAGPTSLDIGLEFINKQTYQKAADLRRSGKIPWPDIRQMLIERPAVSVRCFYAENNVADALQAKNLEGLANVELNCIPDSADHYVLGILHRQGRLDGVLRTAAGSPPPVADVQLRKKRKRLRPPKLNAKGLDQGAAPATESPVSAAASPPPAKRKRARRARETATDKAETTGSQA